MMRMTALVLMTLVATLALAQHHPVYSGKVVRVLDGKTLEIQVRSPDGEAATSVTTRFWGIDLSKDKQHAEAAKQLITKLALDRNVYVDVYGQNGNWVTVQTGSPNFSLSTALVSAGLAHRWKPSGIGDFERHEKELELAEIEAKRKLLGIWKTTGYAPVNGLKMYYEVQGVGEPVVLLHGAFMTITNNWDGWISELAKTRRVIAVEMQGHGRTADNPRREFTSENMADDVAALLKHLKIPRADLIGYSMGGSVAMQCAIRHPERVRKAIIISSTFRSNGAVAGAGESISKLTADDFKGSNLDTEYAKLSPTPNDFPKLVKRLVATASKPYDFGATKLKANKTPMFFIHGDADGVRLAHIAEMFRLKGGEKHGDMGPRSASRLAILPDTTHVTLMQRMSMIVPMVNDFLDAKP